ncbi:hypothetical protein [Stenomitos frigidus]|uniref:NACHT domain-containing protein n=1 Tax=Stenomitos frigidus ULC18 TaxID=2107698 RepID=A0A2T1DTL3_9CYAN|nr:hypothetical protein [Stenomitos frigidus]PSB23771.1 hypothetical protein C7B82_30025 [Stenomitos frigidus ULC18]
MTRQYRNDGRDQIPIENVHGNVYIQEGSRPTRSRSESLLLQAVKQEVISRLDQSLHNAVFINLGKQSQPQQVKRPWDAEIKIGSKSPQPLPAETSILEVFDRPGIDGRLLVLGEPGAGKTTTMLDLAKGLCDRAEQDPTAFIPVLLNLSSWKDPKQTMTAWLVEELKSKYGVRKDIGTKWLAEKQLLPLLDGLDEVKPEHQEGCVQAINHWLESDDRPLSLAVCCRREEYEKVVRGQWQAEAEEAPDETRMHLNGAILLQTLTDEQIQAYLTALKQPHLWQTMQSDEALLELIRTPLFLSIIGLSVIEQKFSFADWRSLTSREAQLQYLFDVFWIAAISRVLVEPKLITQGIYSKSYGKIKPPSTKQIRHWLIFLAQQLQHESQIEFLIEKIQPNWLRSGTKQWLFRISSWLLCGLLIGLVLGPFWSLELSLYAKIFNPNQLGLPFPGDLVSEDLKLMWQENMSKISALHKIYEDLTLSKWLFLELTHGILPGIVYGLIGAVIFGCRQRIEEAINAKKLFQKLLSSTSIFILVGGLMSGVIYRLTVSLFLPSAIVELKYYFIFMVFYTLLGGIVYGLTILITNKLKKYFWRRSFSTIFGIFFSVVGLVSWLISVFLGTATALILFKATLFNALTFGLSSGLFNGLFFGIISLPIFVTASLVSDFIREEISFNQEPQYAVFKVGVFSIIGGIASGLINGLALELANWVRVDFFLASSVVGNTILYGLVGALIYGLIYALSSEEKDKIRPIETLQWSKHRARSGMVTGMRYGLLTWLVLSPISFYAVNLYKGSNSALVLSLFSGFTHLLVGGAIGGIVTGFRGPDVNQRLVPNQGILQSAINSRIFTLTGLLTGLMISLLLTSYNFFWKYGLSADEPLEALIDSLFYGVLVGLVCGVIPGIACIQHVILRLLFMWSGCAPWNYARFLDYCTERLFLQRVGGHYRFIHKSLQEHFAAMRE